nr:serine O-acetyltransferase EpsC [Halogeometricum sp. CBA1124]
MRDAVCRVREDVAAIRDRDPAAGGTLDVLLFYPGMTAVWTHRVAHALWRRNRRFGARALSHLVRLLTAVEIHPGAELGRRVTIDHGAGVVVGETAELGDDVHLYHGVTLGANRPQPGKRHPTVEANAVLGANSTVVGPVTVGERAVVGAGASSLTTSPRARRWSATPRNASTACERWPTTARAVPSEGPPPRTRTVRMWAARTLTARAPTTTRIARPARRSAAPERVSTARSPATRRANGIGPGPPGRSELGAQSRTPRAMTSFCISLVPS